ncbi:MAG: DUF3107 domain-containing protein [Acidimicrobiaceae bacterium]|nr:DUF3107 domain-containing protein [Acidimicrobiaceae bacterium]
MDVRIGVSDHAREIVVQLPDKTDRSAVKASIDEAISGATATLWLTDEKGKEVAVAASKIAFVELGPEGGNPIGFG